MQLALRLHLGEGRFTWQGTIQSRRKAGTSAEANGEERSPPSQLQAAPSPGERTRTQADAEFEGSLRFTARPPSWMGQRETHVQVRRTSFGSKLHCRSSVCTRSEISPHKMFCGRSVSLLLVPCRSAFPS
ncbi:hypothetical protein RvY_13969-2 [Ramazzottius varieornatus]|uniref:Uncharacterized protein n=1 Tax=Ramazzottius varieornatus TaxID=947166 RepID=A0A1D1VRH2_RAMVA|nr:hypothetical protein RvY_13969-2 [Ramazzottius varieornatus]